MTQQNTTQGPETIQQKNIISELEKYANELKESMNSISIDFCGDYYIESDAYISDLFCEFADSMTSIYYSDQRDYYYNNTEQCENDLMELYDNDSLAQLIKSEGLDGLLCKAGACGEFMQNERDLYEDQKNIIKVLLINHIIENIELYKDFTSEELIKVVDDSDCFDYDCFDEYCEYLQKETYEKENED